MNREAIEAEMNMGPLAFLSQIADTYEEEGDADMAKAYRIIIHYAPYPLKSQGDARLNRYGWYCGRFRKDLLHYIPHSVHGEEFDNKFRTLSEAYRWLAVRMIKTGYLDNYESNGSPKKRSRKKA
jgi:hypothetical protein